jgi:hypothetical protein
MSQADDKWRRRAKRNRRVRCSVNRISDRLHLSARQRGMVRGLAEATQTDFPSRES